jgi:xyloglucan-specific exo-beta-1,4-glucanase
METGKIKKKSFTDFTGKLSFIMFLLFFPSITNVMKGQTYGNIKMGGGGFVSGLLTCKTEKDLIYARTDVGGAYRWDVNDSLWIPLNDWVSTGETGLMGVESFAIDPSNPGNFYMLLGTSYFNDGRTVIFRSRDKGNTYKLFDVSSKFKAHGNGMGRNTGEKLVVDPNLGSVLLCGTRENGLFKSADSGTTWNRLTALNITGTSDGNGISLVIFDPASASKGSETQTIFAGVSQTGSNFYRSDDGGETFIAVTGGPATLMPCRAVWAIDTSLYIAYSNGCGPYGSGTETMDKGQIWKYKIKTGIWTNITPSSFNKAFGGVSVDPNDANRIVVSSINNYSTQGTMYGDQIFITTNGGKNWTNKTASGFQFDPNGIAWAKGGMSIHWAGSIEFDPYNTKRVHVVSGNGVFTTDNIDSVKNVWKFNVRGIEETVPYGLISIPGGPLMSVVADYLGTRNTDPDIYGAKLTQGSGSYKGIAYGGIAKNVVYSTGGTSQLYYSTDTGKTWKLCIKINGNSGRVAVSADGNVVLHCPESSSITYRSTDNGTSWTGVAGLTLANAEPFADPVNPKLFYLYPTSGKFFLSSNGGVSFSSSGNAGSGGSMHITTVPGYEGHVWIALYDGGLTRTVSSGGTFTKITSVTACSAVGVGKAVNKNSYPTVYIWGTVGGIEGLYFSTDEGATWNRMNDSEHEWGGPGNGQFVAGDMNLLGYAYMSTVGRGIVYARPCYMLGADSLTINVGSSVQIIDTVLNHTSVNWTWSSANEAVATVSSTGLVTGVSNGTAVIIATTVGGKNLKLAIRVAKKVTGISINPANDAIDVSGQIQMTATVTPQDATNSSVSWSSVDPSIASVSSAGLVTGVKGGKTDIIAIADGKKASKSITVGTLVTGITLDPPLDTIVVSDTIQLEPIIAPANASNPGVVWSSNNTTIATVNSTGLVTGKKTGTATITATTQDGSFQAYSKIVVETAVSSPLTEINNTNITIFPNPSENKLLNIQLGNLKGLTAIRFFDVSGKMVFEQHVIDQSLHQLKLNVAQGLYLVQVVNKEKTFTGKFIIR